MSTGSMRFLGRSVFGRSHNSVMVVVVKFQGLFTIILLFHAMSVGRERLSQSPQTAASCWDRRTKNYHQPVTRFPYAASFGAPS